MTITVCPVRFADYVQKNRDICGQLLDFKCIASCSVFKCKLWCCKSCQIISEIRHLQNRNIDFKDAYFHIPINPQSTKCLHFHVQPQSYQFKAFLPFSQPTIPIEFTMVAKEAKLMAQNKGTRTHQYLDWLVRATSHQACLQHTQTLVTLCQKLGLIVNTGGLQIAICNSKADFLLYIFQERKFQPSTIDGYDSLINSSV